MAGAIDAMKESDLDAAIAIDLVSFVPSELNVAGDDPRTLRERSLREELVRPWARLRAARSEAGDLVGYALFWHVVDELHLLNVAVTPSMRRQGIGRALVNDLVAYARANAAVRILLEVRASNTPAIAMYESLGFTPFNTRPRYYADSEDAIEMSYAVDPAPTPRSP